MPKKGENMKAVAAKTRKDEKASAEKAKKDKEMEDAAWKDDDKQLAKKQVTIFSWLPSRKNEPQVGVLEHALYGNYLIRWHAWHLTFDS